PWNLVIRQGRLNAREWPTIAESGRRKRDDALALALAAQQTFRAAAADAGICERDRNPPAGRSCLPSPRCRAVNRHGEPSAGKYGRAYSTRPARFGSCSTPRANPSTWGAFRALLELGVKLRKSVELEERFDVLKRHAEEEKHEYTQDAPE